MNSALANSGHTSGSGPKVLPGPAPQGRSTGTEEVWFGAVLTLVLWLSCLVVGVLGILLPYHRPQPPATTLPSVQAQILDVEITSSPAGPATEIQPSLIQPVLAELAQPVPIPTRWEIPEPVPMVAVSTPSASVEFAVPLEKSGAVAQPSEGPVEANATPATVASPARPAAVTLTLGQGDGKQPAPAYPRAAVRAGQEGTVRIGLAVGEDGTVLAAEILTASPWPMLNEAALNTVRRQWRFPPGALRRYEVPIYFQLRK